MDTIVSCPTVQRRRQDFSGLVSAYLADELHHADHGALDPGTPHHFGQ